jgi:hypothetical protein
MLQYVLNYYDDGSTTMHWNRGAATRRHVEGKRKVYRVIVRFDPACI